MSADLFAEFASDSISEPSKPSQASAQPARQPPSDFSFFDSFNTAPSQAQPQPSEQHFQSRTAFNAPIVSTDDNDDWGDFEGDSAAVEPVKALPHDPFAFSSKPATHMHTTTQPTSRYDAFASHDQTSIQSVETSWRPAPIIKAKKSADPSVLFDAEDDLDDDDFGDFEGTDTKTNFPAPAPVLTTSSSAMADLLGDMSVSQQQFSNTGSQEIETSNKAMTSSTSRKKSPVGTFGNTVKSKQPEVTTAKAQVEDDAWDTFDDWEASIPTKPSANTSSIRTKESAAAIKSPVSPPPLLSPTSADALPGELPPTNVPPPGVLLTLFPSLFADAQEKLFKPMAAQTLPMRNKLMAEQGTISYLQGYLMLGNVAAHIIAGRKLRWKRDQHLSQGMRIGPASSRATSGMKLTGIDKGENKKEEREASDVVRVWKDQLGRLRHVVSGVNQIKAGTLGAVPDLQETMPVKALKQSEGGMPARQPCMMCGLKREERVTATDMATDDSFGEWWIDQVNMHRGCRNFWNQHKDTLRGR
ncbi:hypothetical protein DE146DRAFT_679577 [Phaeosphaeria sp. MPI-PUGE-AT-0046c]|nr:hypothetical protein DE146DRAFT_679577 [Phaeosphaeria sp. MPI-PUGE-AT-0046c]